MPKEIRFKVLNLPCGNCAGIITTALTSRDFKKKLLRVSVASYDEVIFVASYNKVTSDFTISLDETFPLSPDTEIKKIIETELADYSYVVDFEKEKTVDNSANEKSKSQDLIRNYIIKGTMGTLFGVLFLIICACGFSMPMVAMYILAGLSSLLSLYLGKDTYKAAFAEVVKTKTLTMHTLFTVSTLTAIAVSIASVFVSWLPMMFDAALLIFGFRYLGMAVEEKVRRNVTRNVLFQDRIPDEVEIETEGRREKISVRNLKPGDVIVIHKGNMVPVDSICKNASVFVDASIYKGNSCLFIQKDQALFGGMVVLDDEVKLTVDKTVDDPNSFLALADKKLQAICQQKADVEEIANKILKYFVPIVFGLTIISGICIGLFFTPALALQCVISMLVSACPCTLGFIVPFSISIGMSKGMENGIHFAGGKDLQETAKINAMVFDLNGTLTSGTPTVVRLKSTDKNISKEEVLKYFNRLEKKSDHAIGRTIYAYTEKSMPEETDNDEVVDIVSSSRSGISKKINGVTYTVGNSTMLRKAGIYIKSDSSLLSLKENEQVIYLARDREEIGYVVIQDSLRDNAKTVIKELQQKNIEVFLCTGADKITAERFASILEIKKENVDSDCLPFVAGKTDSADELPAFVEIQHNKVDFIRSLQGKGYKVGMVGDANNDAFAMKQSNVGFAVNSHSNGDIARDKAGALIKGESLLPVLSGLVIAKQTIRNIKQNLAVSLTYNMTVLLIAGGLLLAVGFALNPAIGVALMVLQTCLLLASVYYLKRKSLPDFNNNIGSISEKKESNTYVTLNKHFQRAKPQLSEKLRANTESVHLPAHPHLARLSAAIKGLFHRSKSSQSNGLAFASAEPRRFIPRS